MMFSPALVSRKQLCRAAALVCALLGAAGSSRAAELFQVTASAGGQSGTASYSSAQAAFDGLSLAALQALAPAYTSTSVAFMVIDYRGLKLDTAYPTPGPSLRLTIASLGITQTFNGATREESRQLLRTYFKTGDALDRIMKALAEASPVDPIAGNPASLQTRLVTGSYKRYFSGLASELSGRSLGRTASARAGPPLWLAAAGNEPPVLGDRAKDLDPSRYAAMAEADLAWYSRAGLSSTVASLPFSVTLPTSAERPLSVDGELNLANTEGARTYGGSIALAYRQRISDNWALVPSASIGISVSPDLGGAGTMASVALTSSYRLVKRPDYELWMGNAVNLTRSVSTTLAGYRFNPGLHNLALTNGLMLSLPPAAFLPDLWVELSLNDTRFSGSAVYDRRYNELGLALLSARRIANMPVTLRGELSLINTTHSNGVAAKLQLLF